jgi:hypothetical protein
VDLGNKLIIYCKEIELEVYKGLALSICIDSCICGRTSFLSLIEYILKVNMTIRVSM